MLRSSVTLLLLLPAWPAPPGWPACSRRFNKNSYKYSGLANRGNTVDVSATADAVVVSKSSKKSKAGRMVGSVVKKNARRTNFAVGAEAAGTRPDLKVRVLGCAACLL
jgi:hypothetical protein